MAALRVCSRFVIAFLAGWASSTSAQPASPTDEEIHRLILTGPTQREDEPPPWVERSTSIVALARRIPRNASGAELGKHLARFLDELGRLRRGDMAYAYEAIALLRRNPHVVGGLERIYDGLARQAYRERARVVQVLGELRDARALPFLLKVVRRPLPKLGKKKAGKESYVLLSARAQEEIVQSRAVESMLFLRDARGRRLAEANEAGLKLALEHPSRAVRITAVDAFMWNHNDAPTAATYLYARLPADLHRHVQRPRFHKGADARAFSRDVLSWRKKWASK